MTGNEHERPTRLGAGGRLYIGPKAQTTVNELFADRAEREAFERGCPLTEVWREVLYAGLIATGRATRGEVRGVHAGGLALAALEAASATAER